MINNLQAFCDRNFQMNGLEIHFMAKPDLNHVTRIKEVIFETVDIEELGVYEKVGPFVISMESGQKLMDDLWNAGVRPTDSRDKSDIIQAKNEHIQDLRKIIFDFMTRLK